jgi:hypothetical protein
VAGSDRVVVGSDRDELAVLFPAALQHGMVFEDVSGAINRQGSDRQHLAGFSVTGVAVLCLPPNPRLGRNVEREALIDLVAHEVQHLITRQLLRTPSGETDAERVQETGPLWLHEGHAMVFADSISRDASIRETREHLMRRYRNRALPDLATLETREALDTQLRDVYIGGGVAVSVLIEDHGEEALGTLYQAMGSGTPFTEAFAQAFGESLDTFYASYAERVRPTQRGGTSAVPRHDPETNAVRCVQAQLNALGFNTGYVDGQIGPRTRASLAAYAEARGIRRTTLTPMEAPLWCRMIGLREDGLRDFWPSRNRPLRLAAAGDLPYDVEAYLRRRLTSLHRDAAVVQHTPVAATDVVLVGRNGRDIRAAAREAGVALTDIVRGYLDESCDSAGSVVSLTTPGLAVVCIGQGVRLDTEDALRRMDWRWASIAARLVRFQVTGPAPVDEAEESRIAALGPYWFREGVVARFRMLVTDGLEGGDLRARVMDRYREAQMPGLETLVLPPPEGASPAEVRRLSALAVSLLVEARGADSIGRMMDVMAAGVPFDAAFAGEYGVLLQAFYAHFPGMPVPNVAPARSSAPMGPLDRDLAQPARRAPVN